MAEHEFFSHVTSAFVHGLRLPIGLERRLELDVAVQKPHRAPRDARIRGHHLIERPGLVVVRHGLRVANVVETLCQLAAVLDDEQLIVAVETVLPPRRPSSRVLHEQLVAAFSDPHRPYSAKLQRVARRIRIGSRSAQETRFRLALEDAGLPDGLLNHLWTGPDGIVTEGDIVYPEQRVWIEVEGDQHRTDKWQWRTDVVRYERLTDLEWRVIRVTEDDISSRRDESVDRVRRALARHR